MRGKGPEEGNPSEGPHVTVLLPSTGGSDGSSPSPHGPVNPRPYSAVTVESTGVTGTGASESRKTTWTTTITGSSPHLRGPTVLLVNTTARVPRVDEKRENQDPPRNVT